MQKKVNRLLLMGTKVARHAIEDVFVPIALPLALEIESQGRLLGEVPVVGGNAGEQQFAEMYLVDDATFCKVAAAAKIKYVHRTNCSADWAAVRSPDCFMLDKSVEHCLKNQQISSIEAEMLFCQRFSSFDELDRQYLAAVLAFHRPAVARRLISLLPAEIRMDARVGLKLVNMGGPINDFLAAMQRSVA